MSEKDEGQEDITKLKEQIAELTEKLGNATGELTEGRKTRQYLEAERDALTTKLKEAEEKAKDTPGDKPEDVESAVRKILAERSKQDAQANRTAAEAKFKSAHTEFADDADAGGVKFGAVKAKFSKFNLESIVTVDEFMNLFEEAYTLAVPARTREEEDYNPDAHTPSNQSASPKETATDKLSYKEKKVMERLGWTTEQFLKQKVARPTYIRQLLAHME